LLRSRFWNGLLAGSVLGAVMAWFISPEMKPEGSRRMMGRSRKAQSGARRIIRRVRDGVSDMMDD
jgi:hypothetical protein